MAASSLIYAFSAELHRAGIVLQRDRFLELFAKAHEVGRRVSFNFPLRGMIHNFELQKGVDPVCFSASNIERCLGLSYLLTKFLTAPITVRHSLEEDMIDAVACAGALANLIVSSFDELLDAGLAPEEVLPHAALKVLANRPSDSSGWAEVGGLPGFTDLVQAYFILLDQLHSTSTAASQTKRFLLKCIFTMYDAEAALSRPRAPYSETSWRRKSGLPFVVLGVPVWLSTGENDSCVKMAHLAWLYRIGCFFGTVDDLVDLEADRSNFRVNRVAHRFLYGDNDQNHEALFKSLSRTAVCLMRRYRSWVPEDCEQRRTEQYFILLVESWLRSLPKPDV